MVFVWRPRAWNLTLQRLSVRWPCPNTFQIDGRGGNKARQNKRTPDADVASPRSPQSESWGIDEKHRKLANCTGLKKIHLRRGLFSRLNSAVSEDGIFVHEEREHQKISSDRHVSMSCAVQNSATLFHPALPFSSRRRWASRAPLFLCHSPTDHEHTRRAIC